MIRIGIDTGGTFTDFVIQGPSGMRIRKVLSTPRDPSGAIVRGLEEGGVPAGEGEVIHGSTVATNALLERRGAKLAFLTTAGFEDLLAIGRQTRLELYNIMVEKRIPLVPRELCFGVPERTYADGTIGRKADLRRLDGIIRALKKSGVESVAVCFLHAYANPANEKRVRRRLAEHGFSLSVSHEVLNEYREFERASTTAINAYVAPLMERYLGRLEEKLGAGVVQIMQSNGGCISAMSARAKPVATILSGPAGGVVGAKEIAAAAGFPRIISFDMGGTSTDVSLCDGMISTTPETKIGGLPLRLPVIDIHTVGSGGGSVAFLDAGGALRVGPRSAGADPGPVCYGKGDEVTVTDANLILGRLDPDRFLGGEMKLHPERSRRIMGKFATRLGMDASQLAEGIIRVADATMERAIRVISVERGFDPREFALFSFGGAGGMHACSLARRLRIPKVIVPRNAGVLSALGMLLSDTLKDYSLSILRPGREIQRGELDRLFRPLVEEARRELRREGFGEDKIRLLRSLDVRYAGQSYEITVPFSADYTSYFHRQHLRRYGYADEKRPVEVVNMRVKAVGLTDKPRLAGIEPGGADPARARIERRSMRFDGRNFRAVLYAGEKLRSGNKIAGPALILDYESTAVVPPNFFCRVDGFGNLIMENREG
ncbi:MAG: hydantoinase/oxoprolinase family protein [Candidatus Aminicenantes bacterium]|nr:hydantoinase/oxoprolinase family protein [Candidatus Aminicenantes bacterium]